ATGRPVAPGRAPGPRHYLEAPAKRLPDPGLQRPGVGAIRPDQLQARQGGLEVVQQPGGASAIRNIGWMRDDSEHQTKGIDQQVALAAGELLAPIVTVR